MKRYLISLTILLFLAGCGAGGGVSSISDGLSGGNNNPPPSAKSKIAKIKVNKDGIYRIAFSDLNTASVDLSGKSIESLKLTNNGDEIAIDVIDPNINGIFDDGDSVEFYGRAIPRGDKSFRYTETNVYWLSSEAGVRKRMDIEKNSSSQGALSFLKVLDKEEDTYYEQKNLSTEDVNEHWFWGEAFYTPDVAGNDTSYYRRDKDFNTYGIDKTQPVIVRIRLQSINGSHHIREIGRAHV